MIVADVNLVAYLLLGGPGQAIAERVLERDPVWAAPLLWRSEFRHVLADQLLAGQEFTVPGERVLALVAASPCSAYDCEYVALAEELGVPLLTTDRQLLHEFPARAISPNDFLAGA